MRRALMGLNLYGREAARHKLKNGQKTQKMHRQVAQNKTNANKASYEASYKAPMTRKIRLKLQGERHCGDCIKSFGAS